jgi:magnesium-transporting ATPase (P-type)
MVVTVFLQEYIYAGVIAAALAINASIGFVHEWQAEPSVLALMRLVSPRARVIREGRGWEVDSQELVLGDLVLLESGGRVPAHAPQPSAGAPTPLHFYCSPWPWPCT